MTTLFRHCLAGAALAAFISFSPLATAANVVLTFDDIAQDGLVPANYGGLDWSASTWSVFSGEQDPYTAHSGTGRALTEFQADDSASTIRFQQDVVFGGAWFAGLGGATVAFQLYHDGALVGTSATLDPSAVPAFLSSGYNGLVDAIVLTSPEHGSFVMDDFSFTTTSAVPEPDAASLLLAGLALLAAPALRRRLR